MRRYVFLLTTLSIILGIPACRSGRVPDPPLLTSGVEGRALMGPTCPGPARRDRPCPDKPLQALFFVMNADGREIARFTSDAEGRFRIALPPEIYIIVPDPASSSIRDPGGRKEITVKTGEFTAVEWHFDTGMR
jgi:hypothetical protein